MNSKIMSLLLLFIVAIGFSGAASATSCEHTYKYNCPYCNYHSDSQSAFKNHLESCHQAKVVVIQGEQGPAGQNGTNGKDGLNGTNGKDGAQGPQGIAGVVDYTKVQSMINSATSGLQAQINAINADLKHVWKSINWIIEVNVNQINLIDDLQSQINNIQLTPGPKGDTGAQGIQGIQGLIGATGAVGPQGETGLTGAQGPQGLPGLNGIDGINGTVGAQGPQGEQGIQGLIGPQGIQGVPGLAGAVGEAGQSGVNGLNGLNGIDGANGVSAAKSIPMQDTGINWLPLILAGLVLAGAVGYAVVKRESEE